MFWRDILKQQHFNRLSSSVLERLERGHIARRLGGRAFFILPLAKLFPSFCAHCSRIYMQSGGEIECNLVREMRGLNGRTDIFSAVAEDKLNAKRKKQTWNTFVGYEGICLSLHV